MLIRASPISLTPQQPQELRQLPFTPPVGEPGPHAPPYAPATGAGDYLLTPDPDDADGDLNPWYADENGDGFNDLLVALEAPDPDADVTVVDMNNFGVVVGYCGDHVLRVTGTPRVACRPSVTWGGLIGWT